MHYTETTTIVDKSKITNYANEKQTKCFSLIILYEFIIVRLQGN